MSDVAGSRKLGWLGTVGIAFGSVNLSLIVINSLINAQGTAAIPLLAAAVGVSLLAAFGYLELVLMYPEKSGGICAVCADAFKNYNPLLANIAGTSYWFAWLVATSFGALICSSAIQHFFLPAISINIMSTVLILGATALTMLGLNTVKKITVPIAALAATLALISSLIPVLTGQVNWQQATSYTLEIPFIGHFGTLTSIMAALYLLGWVAPAVESSLCYVSETENPAKNVPRAFFISYGLSFIYYIICPLIWLGALGATPLREVIFDLSPLYAPIFGSIAKEIAAWFLIFNMLSCIITPLCSAPRTLAQIAHDGLVPAFLGRTLKNGTPWVATLLTAFIALWFIWSNSPSWYIAATNFQYLLCLSLASVAVWLLRKDQPAAPRLYRAPKGFIVLGLLSAAIWVSATLIGFQQYGFVAMIFGISFSFSGTLLYAWRKIADRIERKEPIFPATLHIKLTGTMIIVLICDAIGYLFAIRTIGQADPALVAMLEDIFVLVAFLTLSIGLVVPGMICHAAEEVNRAAKKLIHGPLQDFSLSMQALGRGDLDAVHVQADINLIQVNSYDEIGKMAAMFNEMQIGIQKSAISVISAKEGLIDARKKLVQANNALKELNETLEQRVKDRTRELEAANIHLKNEIAEREKFETVANDLNQQLIIAARRAGMAEIATSVLHNVGNVLNSVNTSWFLIYQHTKKSKLEKLPEIAKLLNEHEHDLADYLVNTEHGQKVLQYLRLLSTIWQEQQQAVLTELANMNQGIGHISEIINSEQAMSKSLGVIEKLQITDVIQHAIVINKLGCESANINVSCDTSLDVKVLVDRVRLLQILTNLIKNSIDAIKVTQHEERVIKIIAARIDEQKFQIVIADTGIGITEDNLKYIFTYGFTTKKDGHGYGLHTCAIAIKEMGGELIVTSAGENKGAQFTIILPIEPVYEVNS